MHEVVWDFSECLHVLHKTKPKYRKLTFEITAIFATASRILNQIPRSCALSAIGRLVSQMSLFESIRISKMLFASAKNGARGNAATKIVMNPNCITSNEKRNY